MVSIAMRREHEDTTAGNERSVDDSGASEHYTSLGALMRQRSRENGGTGVSADEFVDILQVQQLLLENSCTAGGASSGGGGYSGARRRTSTTSRSLLVGDSAFPPVSSPSSYYPYPPPPPLPGYGQPGATSVEDLVALWFAGGPNPTDFRVVICSKGGSSNTRYMFENKTTTK